MTPVRLQRIKDDDAKYTAVIGVAADRRELLAEVAALEELCHGQEKRIHKAWTVLNPETKHQDLEDAASAELEAVLAESKDIIYSQHTMLSMKQETLEAKDAELKRFRLTLTDGIRRIKDCEGFQVDYRFAQELSAWLKEAEDALKQP